MEPNAASRCPRCRGRLLEQGDQYGRYWSCLTCGYVDACCLGPDLIPTETVTGQRSTGQQPLEAPTLPRLPIKQPRPETGKDSVKEFVESITTNDSLITLVTGQSRILTTKEDLAVVNLLACENNVYCARQDEYRTAMLESAA